MAAPTALLWRKYLKNCRDIKSTGTSSPHDFSRIYSENGQQAKKITLAGILSSKGHLLFFSASCNGKMHIFR
jgi:hypothetical protein